MLAGCEKMVRSDEFWDGAFVDMGIEQGVWDAALVTAPSRTICIHGPFFHHHLYKFSTCTIQVKDRGGTVVKVLRYKSEGRWFDSRWCHWNFSLT